MITKLRHSLAGFRLPIERVDFASHLKSLKWRQGEHLVIAGPTGSGKTTLAKSLLERRGHVLGFAVKAKDPTLMKEYSDWEFVEDIADTERWMNRVMLWPRLKRKEDADDWRARQKVAFKRAFNVMIKSDGWCLYLDELKYMCDPKFGGVASEIEMLSYIGRSAGTTLISSVQRPSYVPLAVLSNSSHAYLAQTHQAEDVKRLAELGGINKKEIAETLAGLPDRHDFVYQPTLAVGTPGIINTRA